MCCRYYYADEYRDMLDDIIKSERIKVADPVSAEPGQDVRPSDASTVICGGRDGLSTSNMRWGFSNPYRKGLIINARAETAREKNLFSESILKRRIIVPASGFYEWDPYKSRFRFTMPGNGLVLLAGFYHEEKGIPRYTIITTEANDSMRPVHDRMPVMIGRNEIGAWIQDDEKLAEFLERPQVQLVREQDTGQIRMDFGI